MLEERPVCSGLLIQIFSIVFHGRGGSSWIKPLLIPPTRAPWSTEWAGSSGWLFLPYPPCLCQGGSCGAMPPTPSPDWGDPLLNCDKEEASSSLWSQSGEGTGRSRAAGKHADVLSCGSCTRDLPHSKRKNFLTNEALFLEEKHNECLYASFYLWFSQ